MSLLCSTQCVTLHLTTRVCSPGSSHRDIYGREEEQYRILLGLSSKLEHYLQHTLLVTATHNLPRLKGWTIVVIVATNFSHSLFSLFLHTQDSAFTTKLKS